MKTAPNYSCDLHCHTTRSDGNDEPAELLEKAGELGMKTIAITDHDIVPPDTIIKDGTTIDIIEYARSLSLQLVKGIEISCDTEVEDVHLLAFGCRWDAKFFASLQKQVEDSKIESYQKLIEILRAHGMAIYWDEILAFNNVESRNVQKKFIFERLAQKGYAASWQDAKLMVKSNPAFNVKREKPDPRRVIEEIHLANGIAILAHPYLISQTDRDPYIDRLISAGLDGIEACYTYDKTSYRGTQSKYEIEQAIVQRYSDRVKILSGGSDYHADQKKGVANARQIGECGISSEYFYVNDLLGKLI